MTNAHRNLGILEQEDWIAPTLTNNWVNYGPPHNQAGYYKDSLGIVHLRGLVRNGAQGTDIFTLPDFYRPAYRELQAVQTNPNAIGRVDIKNTGQVHVSSGNSSWFSLNGVTFRAAKPGFPA